VSLRRIQQSRIGLTDKWVLLVLAHSAGVYERQT